MKKNNRKQDTQLLKCWMINKCLIVSHPWSIISQVHVVIVAHLNNSSEIQIHEEPEASTS